MTATLLGPTGCGDDEENPSPSEGCRLSEAELEHACSHIESGPFREATPRPSTPWEDVSFPHTAYRVAETSSAGWVSFEPFEAGLHVFFLTGGPRDMSLEAGRGEASLTPLANDGSSCSLTSMGVVQLEEGVYPLRWSPGPGRTLVIEAVSPEDIICEPTGAEIPTYGPPSDARPSPDAGIDPDAGVQDGSNSAPMEDAGFDPLDAGPGSDAGSLPDAGAADVGVCTELGEACRNDNTCCSGRCYSRICVAAQCRTEGSCTSDAECCLFCHQDEQPHCH